MFNLDRDKVVVVKRIENCGAWLLADLLLAEEKQHFHDNLLVCVCVLSLIHI